MDLLAFQKFSRKPLPTCIHRIDYAGSPKHGWFSLVGSIPVSLTKPSTVGLPGTIVSQSWPTLEDARAAVEAAGVERYQLPDCSWNKAA